MMKNTEAIDVIWRIALREAIAACSEVIEPEHFLEALTKAGECVQEGQEYDNRCLDVDSAALAVELRFVPDLLTSLGINPRHLRRGIRALLGIGTFEYKPGSIVHRSERARNVMHAAQKIAIEMALAHLHAGCLLIAILSENNSNASTPFARLGFPVEEVKAEAFRGLKAFREECQEGALAMRPEHPPKESGSSRSILEQFGRDLTQAAREGLLSPVIGRRQEILQVIQTLALSMKNNPLLIGDPGVGKTAIVEAVAQRIADGKDFHVLGGKRIVEIRMGALVAGTKYRGEFEGRVKKLLAEAEKDKQLILFIDEIHTMIGAGDREGGLDAANLMKPALARGGIKCIGATTVEEYRKHIEKDAALARRFNLVMVEEPTQVDAVEILKGLRSRFENHHGVQIPDKTIEAAVDLSIRFDGDHRLPDKAIDLLDMASVKGCVPGLSVQPLKGDHAGAQSIEVTPAMIVTVLAVKTGVPESIIAGGFAKTESTMHLHGLKDRLQRRVIGQDAPIDCVAKRVLLAHAGLDERRGPLAVFLFLGPSGVGKTELARVLAEELLGSVRNLIRLDMSEFMEQHSVARLIGSPPGYIGHEEEGQLTGKLRSAPCSIVLLDEIEKAHPKVLDVFLQIFDEGRITDGHGRTVDAKNSIFIMTSNIGKSVQEIPSPMGFNTPLRKSEDIRAAVNAEIRRHFRIELINRIDEIVRFSPLSISALSLIARQHLQRFAASLEERYELCLEVPEEVVSALCPLACSSEFGARNLKRIIQDYIEIPIAQMISEGLATGKARLRASSDAGRFRITVERCLDDPILRK